MQMTESCAACEGVLDEHKTRNLNLQIYPDHNRIIDRMLERRLELESAYEELFRKVEGDRQSLYVFFDGLLCVASTWHPKQVAKSRADRNRLIEVNRKIAKAAGELAGLLVEREQLNNDSGFYSDTHFGVRPIIEIAARFSSHDARRLRSALELTDGHVDSKYWPDVSAFAQVIAEDATDPKIHASNSTTAAATRGPRSGDADFFRAFDRRLTEEGVSFWRLSPSRLNLTDAAFAAFASCALDRGGNDLFDADFVKRWRQREREASKRKRTKVSA